MDREIENPMVNDAYWGDFGEDFGEEESEEEEYDEDDDYEWLKRIEEEELDEDAAYIAEHGWGRANGYVL